MNGHRAELAGKALDLTPTEFDLLSVFLQNPGRAFTRLELLDRVQGYAYEGYERTVDAHIKNVRNKLRAVQPDVDPIVTHRGSGYSLKEGL